MACISCQFGLYLAANMACSVNAQNCKKNIENLEKIRPVTVSRPHHYTVHQEIGSLGPKDQLWEIVGNAKVSQIKF